MAVKPIPDGYPTVIPYLSVEDGNGAIDFYVAVLGGRERMRMPGPGGCIAHAEVEIGTGLVMLSDMCPEGAPAPSKLGGTAVSVMVYVADVDAVHAAAVAAGAKSLSDPTNQFYGDRSAAFLDPFGHRWHIATHIEDVDPEEAQRRMSEAMTQAG
jgi:PhnB protein